MSMQRGVGGLRGDLLEGEVQGALQGGFDLAEGGERGDEFGFGSGSRRSQSRD